MLGAEGFIRFMAEQGTGKSQVGIKTWVSVPSFMLAHCVTSLYFCLTFPIYKMGTLYYMLSKISVSSENFFFCDLRFLPALVFSSRVYIL